MSKRGQVILKDIAEETLPLTIGCDGHTIGIKAKEGRGLAQHGLTWEIPGRI